MDPHSDAQGEDNDDVDIAEEADDRNEDIEVEEDNMIVSFSGCGRRRAIFVE